MKHTISALITALLLAPLVAIVHGAVPAPTEAQSTLGTPDQRKTVAGAAYDFYSDVSFPAADGSQRMDVHLPAGQSGKRRPAVLIVHGGGWATGDKAQSREVEFATFMVDDGCVAISINCTLTRFDGKPLSSKKMVLHIKLEKKAMGRLFMFEMSATVAPATASPPHLTSGS